MEKNCCFILCWILCLLVYFWSSWKMDFVFSRKNITCEILGIWPLIHIKQNLSEYLFCFWKSMLKTDLQKTEIVFLLFQLKTGSDVLGSMAWCCCQNSVQKFTFLNIIYHSRVHFMSSVCSNGECEVTDEAKFLIVGTRYEVLRFWERQRRWQQKRSNLYEPNR